MVRPRGFVTLVCAGVLVAGCAADVGPDDGPGDGAGAEVRTPLAVGSEVSAPDTGPRRRDCAIPTRLAGRDVDRLPVQDKVVALTFDGGANADGVPSIRATLRRTNVRATFFLTGSFVRRYPAKSRRLAVRHLIGNHTMTHPDVTTLSDQGIAEQVRDAEDVIRTRTGEDPRRFFRFPFGAADDHVIDVVNGLCYVPFRWTVDTLGWKGTSGGQSVASVVSRVLAAAQPGAIVLMHVGSNPDDGTTLDADALAQVIRKLRARDYRFVRLARVMSPKP